MMHVRPNLNEARSKIVATVGPACEDLETLIKLVEHGVDVFRINAAHGDQEDFERIVGKIRTVRERTGFPVAVLFDLSGPKIRLGQLGIDPMHVEVGDELTFIRGEASEGQGQLCCTYDKLIDEVKVDDTIMLADGTITLRVTSRDKDSFICKSKSTGTVRSRQGINLPGVTLSVSAMREEDVENAMWAARNGVDFISLSFVRSAKDVSSLRNLVTSLGSKALIIAKIEKREALDQLEEIVEESDGIMVARGDLGVEIDVAETPVAQKRIIDVCRDKLKPVIVATQMLESMHTNSRPTRAEASDVANAILDGADACMLSGETAIGKFPVESVDTMDRIMVHTEQMLKDRDASSHKPTTRVHPVTSAVTYNAANIAEAIDAKLVVVASRTGGTAWVKSKQRNFIPTLGVSNDQQTLQRMCLFWGIMPHYSECLDDPQQLYHLVSEWGKKRGLLQLGDRVVFVTGTGVIDNTHNMLVVHELQG